MERERTIADSVAETRRRHALYLKAVNHPLRRRILEALREGDATLEELSSKTELDEKTLEWHLGVLEHGFCVERVEEGGRTLYRLTEEGRVIEYL
ncbi:MAG: putative transcriptional regulatory protein [Candidatus Bathyarchaeota archaeon B23]|nr:MAG: putative transcriptional regulatory protein [Candidatus Bathyarchaeota archaeon B23]